MSEDILNKFGMLLMQQVRDKVIEQFDMTLSRRIEDRTYKFLKSRVDLSDVHVKDILQLVIPIIVDSTLDSFLALIESQKEIDLIYEPQNGTEAISIKDTSDGLSGELHGKRGWVANFSNKRSYEDEKYKDL